MGRTSTSSRRRVAVFPGTFDPVTHGHLDVIRRGGKLFDELIVAVGENPEKHALLSVSQRVKLLREVTADLPNVRVAAYRGLTADFVRSVGATALLRGLRGSSDLPFEFQTALTNRVVAGVETVFVMTGPAYAFTSSSLIRQVAAMGGDISAFVPPAVQKYLRKSCRRRKG